MILPQMEFTMAEHAQWTRERANLYDMLGNMPSQVQQRELLSGLRRRHSELIHTAFLMCHSGIQLVPVSENEDLLLCHTRPATTDTIGVALSYQVKPEDKSWATFTKSIAVFGEKIAFEPDIASRGRGGFGVNSGPEPFLGVLATLNAPHRVERFIPYDGVELTYLERLLQAFDPQHRPTTTFRGGIKVA